MDWHFRIQNSLNSEKKRRCPMEPIQLRFVLVYQKNPCLWGSHDVAPKFSGESRSLLVRQYFWFLRLVFHTVDVFPSVSSFKQAAFVYATHLLSWPGKWEKCSMNIFLLKAGWFLDVGTEHHDINSRYELWRGSVHPIKKKKNLLQRP